MKKYTYCVRTQHRWVNKSAEKSLYLVLTSLSQIPTARQPDRVSRCCMCVLAQIQQVNEMNVLQLICS